MSENDQRISFREIICNEQTRLLGSGVEALEAFTSIYFHLQEEELDTI